MKLQKRLLSLFLAICVACSAMGVGFYAIAAQQEDTVKKDAAVTELETGIADWSSNHSKYLYSTKDTEADQKAAAQKAFEDINAKMQKLSEAQKLSMSVGTYAYWMSVAQDSVVRTENKMSPTTANRTTVLMNQLDRIQAIMGTIPGDYMDALNAMKAFGVKADGTYEISNAKCNFKKAEAAKVLLDFLDTFKGLNENATTFIDYIIPAYGGYYINYSISDKTGALVGSLCNYLFNYQQDITEGSSGENPKSVSTSTYIQRTSGTPVTYSWKAGQGAAAYIAGFNKYLADTQASQVKPANNALAQLLDVLDSKPQYAGVKGAVNAAVQVGLQVKDTGTAAVADIEAAKAKVGALTGTATTVYDKVMGSSYLKVAAELLNPYTDPAGLTAELGYNKPTRMKTYNPKEVYQLALNVLEDLKLQDFTKFVAGVNLAKKTEADAKQANSLYVALSNTYKGKIDADTLAKYMQIVKPAADPNNFAKEVKNFKPTTIVRPKDSQVAMTKGGIQSAVDNLWSLVSTMLVPMIDPNIDLTNGLDSVLEDNVYTIKTINAIFDLYATLSHNETETGQSVAPTIGKVVQLLITTKNYANMLDEEKYAGVVKLISENCTVTKDEEAQGINDLDKLAAIEFTAADFGFKDGDRAGFEDALLAALRPITTLLRDESLVLSFAKVKFHMFDYLDADGQYVDGLYARLIPLLEQLGLTSLPTPDAYKANFEAVAAKSGKDIASDEFLRPILDALFKDLVDVISPDPLNGLIQVLPRVAYIIDQDMLTTTLKDVAQSTGDLLGGLVANLDLSGKFFNNLLTQSPIDLSGLVGTDCKLQLKAVDWKKLANCCTVKSVPSHSNHNDYFLLRTGETDTVFTTVFYYVYDVAFADKANYKALTAAIKAKAGALSSTILGYTDHFVAAGKVATYGEILDLLGTPGDEPIDPGNNNNKPNKPSKPSNNKPGTTKPGNKDNSPKSDDNQKAPTKGNGTKGGNWKSPATGASIFGGAALLAVGGALMILAIRRKDHPVTD